MSCTSDRAREADAVTRHNWWNYYERGCRRLEAGRPSDARDDFERCLGLRPGAAYAMPEELRRARTYGLHFQEQYFPHRELGVAFFQLGEMTQAVHWLERSIRKTPSGRAKFYLNAARRALLAGRRTEAPQILVDHGPGPTWTRGRRVRVTGAAKGSGFISDIAIQERPQFIELAENRIAFAQEIALAEGTNTVRVEARDLAGNRATSTAVWVADWRAPDVVVRQALRTGGSWRVQGRCADNGALRRLLIRNATQAATLVDVQDPAGDVPFDVVFREGENIVLDAEDTAGNLLQTSLGEERLAFRHHAGVLLAESTDERADVQAGLGVQDPSPPWIDVDAPAVTRVFNEDFVLQGSVADPAGLESVQVAGQEWLAAEDQGALTFDFARRMALAPGTNRFALTARNGRGMASTHEWTVIRKTPSHLDTHYRLALVMPPFIPSAVSGSALADRLRRQAGHELALDPQRFFVVERDEGWDLLLREQRLSVSDLADPRAALDLGKMLAAELLLVGAVFSHGEGTTVYATIYDAETGVAVADDDVYSEAMDAELADKMGGLVAKLEQRFPLVEGHLTRLGGNKADLDVGREQGARAGMKLLVVRPASPSGPIEEGTVCAVADKPVELRITELDARSGSAEIRPGPGRAAVQPGDYVYAR